jgi:hypothetical protein
MSRNVSIAFSIVFTLLAGAAASGCGGGATAPAPDGGGGAGGSSLPGAPNTCHGGLPCVVGQTCRFDCMGHTGSDATGLAGPEITCSCSSASLTCQVMFEGNAGATPTSCPADPQGATCASVCEVCQSADGMHTCFCSTELVWVCT